jgi:signal transduction histidine kinase
VRLLELIVSNLAENGLKFTPPDGVVDIGAAVEGGSLSIWVRDEGIGIDEGQISRIFERFYQVDSSTTRTQGGVGLGLDLVRAAVEELGGTIQVASEVGRGSTFTVRLPLPTASAPSAPPDRSAQEASTG